MEDYCAAVVDGGLVVSGGLTTPVFEQIASAFDGVGISVVDGVDSWWAAAADASAFAVSVAVGWFWYHGGDAAGA